jgi:hypothetical protein
MDSLIEKLPDDIIIKIYTKYLRKYRFHDGKLIKLIDFEKYKFLEKFISRKIVNVSKVKTYDENSGRELPTNILEIKYTLANFCELPDRKDQLIDDDMMYVYLSIKDDAVSYIIQKFRLKKIEDFLTKHKPSSIYHIGNYYRGNYQDYDWEVSTLSDLYFV